MSISQSGPGEVVFFEDFAGIQEGVALTNAPPIRFGNFLSLVGQGLAETDSGAIRLDSDGVSGVIQLTTTDEDVHAAGFQTASMLDVGLTGPIVIEARVREAVITTGEFFFGISDVNTDLAIIEGAICHGGTATLTLTASDVCGFLHSTELTNSDEWHAVFNGGSTTGVTSSVANELGVTLVAGDYNILRLEFDPNGTVRWYIDGVLKKTVKGAVSTSVDMCVNLIVESKTTAVKTADVDYVMLKCNRDWTV